VTRAREGRLGTARGDGGAPYASGECPPPVLNAGKARGGTCWPAAAGCWLLHIRGKSAYSATMQAIP
jgi:hypothetical protein